MSQQDPETKETTTTTTTKEQPNVAEKPKRTLPKLSTGWWVLIAVFAFFALLGVFAIGSAAVHMASNRATRAVGIYGEQGVIVQNDGNGFRTGGMMGGRRYLDDTSTTTTTTTTTTRLSGVVTAVDGSMITVAGNGTTNKVIVNDSTTYTGSTKPAAVNDTIIAVGTTSGDTFTATRVVLQRQ